MANAPLSDSQTIKTVGSGVHLRIMGRWPFKRKSGSFDNEPHIRGSRLWIQDLREVCGLCFDNRAEGQRRIRQMQVEWRDAHAEGEVDDALLQGLDRRAFRLLRADESEWVRWLDEDGFWKPGWGSSEATE